MNLTGTHIQPTERGKKKVFQPCDQRREQTEKRKKNFWINLNARLSVRGLSKNLHFNKEKVTKNLRENGF